MHVTLRGQSAKVHKLPWDYALPLKTLYEWTLTSLISSIAGFWRLFLPPLFLFFAPTSHVLGLLTFASFFILFFAMISLLRKSNSDPTSILLSFFFALFLLEFLLKSFYYTRPKFSSPHQSSYYWSGKLLVFERVFLFTSDIINKKKIRTLLSNFLAEGWLKTNGISRKYDANVELNHDHKPQDQNPYFWVIIHQAWLDFVQPKVANYDRTFMISYLYIIIRH